jgi:small subunit ribosomal protein S9
VYLQNQVERPLKTIEAADKFDVKINATGGGVKGQLKLPCWALPVDW